jgi:hypothetical protein
MERGLHNIIEGIGLSEDLRREVLFLYNVGVDLEDLKYFLALKLKSVL